MRVTNDTKRILAFRREEKRLLAQGYKRHRTDWEIHCGEKYREVIVDAVVSCDGKYVYTKLGYPSGYPSYPNWVDDDANPKAHQ